MREFFRDASQSKHKKLRGFTIVELLIVVVVIAILATITVVAYNGITANAVDSALKADLNSAAKQLHAIKIADGEFPDDLSSIDKTSGATLNYTRLGDRFCIAGVRGDRSLHLFNEGDISDGECPSFPVVAGEYMQQITANRCPVGQKVMVRDARDDRSYWIQKLADGKCWMLTNLSYAGAGDNSYGDVIPQGVLTQHAAISTPSFTEARYYTPPGANPTTYPQTPSDSTDGGATKPQYGYIYNKCAAGGAQLGTWYCAETYSPVNIQKSICPTGWRLPSGGSGYGPGHSIDLDFQNLSRAINGGSATSSSGYLESWLAQYSGAWKGSFTSQGQSAHFWSSSNWSDSESWHLSMSPSSVGSVGMGTYTKKSWGLAVRCTL